MSLIITIRTHVLAFHGIVRSPFQQLAFAASH